MLEAWMSTCSPVTSCEVMGPTTRMFGRPLSPNHINHFGVCDPDERVVRAGRGRARERSRQPCPRARKSETLGGVQLEWCGQAIPPGSLIWDRGATIAASQPLSALSEVTISRLQHEQHQHRRARLFSDFQLPSLQALSFIVFQFCVADRCPGTERRPGRRCQFPARS